MSAEQSSGNDRLDAQFGVILAMALTLLVVLATAHLEDLHFVVTTLGDNGSFDGSPAHQRRTKFDLVAGAHCEHLVERDFCANVCRYLFYFKFFASSNFVLLTAGFYDRVHCRTSRCEIKRRKPVLARFRSKAEGPAGPVISRRRPCETKQFSRRKRGSLHGRAEKRNENRYIALPRAHGGSAPHGRSADFSEQETGQCGEGQPPGQATGTAGRRIGLSQDGISSG